jgi:GH15 family glucan-1,4-alpha-glucosidase
VLLAAKEIYDRIDTKPHWKTIVKTADFLVKHWTERDHGIWEEQRKEHFTYSKVIVTRALEYIAMHTDDEQQKSKWQKAADDIRQFVSQHSMTKDGAYAVYVGSEEVDVTAALFAVWEYDTADSAAMKQTIKRIEGDLKEGDLYHRRLVSANWKKEGVFLAGCLWVAQYYVMLNNREKAKTIIDAVLQFATDLGFLSEEGDVTTGEPLGNIPQTFVHASLMGAIVDYKKAADESVQ